MENQESEQAQKAVDAIKDGRSLDAKSRIYDEINSIERSQYTTREKADSEEAFLQALLSHNKELEQANLPPLTITHQGRDILIGRPEQGPSGSFQNENSLYGEFSDTSYGLIHRNDPDGPLKSMLHGNVKQTDVVANNATTLQGSERIKQEPVERVQQARPEVQRTSQPYGLEVDQNDGAIKFNQTANYHGNTETFGGQIRVETRAANAQLWFPYDQNFWPKPGQEIRVKGNVTSDNRGYGDNNQYQLNEFQGSIKLNARTHQPEFVGTLTDSGKGIGFDVTLPLRSLGRR